MRINFKHDVINLTGDIELTKTLDKLKEASARKIMRPAMGAGLTLLNKEVKARVPKDTGLLKKAIGKKTPRVSKGSKNKGRLIGAKVYVRTGYESEKNGRKVDPVKYAHLVEFGTKHVKARPFMRRALKEEKTRIQKVIATKARQRLAIEAKKAKAKGKTL